MGLCIWVGVLVVAWIVYSCTGLQAGRLSEKGLFSAAFLDKVGRHSGGLAYLGIVVVVWVYSLCSTTLM